MFGEFQHPKEQAAAQLFEQDQLDATPLTLKAIKHEKVKDTQVALRLEVERIT